MINVKVDKGVSTMTFAGSGLEITAEICAMVHELYTQLYHRAGPAMASGCKGPCWICWRERILLCGMRIWKRA